MSNLDEMVCLSCGQADCWNGVMYCEGYRRASAGPRWRYERNEAVKRLSWLVAETGWASDGTLLQAVSLVERRMS